MNELASVNKDGYKFEQGAHLLEGYPSHHRSQASTARNGIRSGEDISVASCTDAVLLSHATPVVDTSAIQQASVVQHFTSPGNPDISLQFVADSGVCETTPGVHQMSGYINVGTTMVDGCGLSRLG